MEVRTVAVIGAGTMGAGIAQVCAQSGWHTRIFDAFPNSLENGIERIKSFWEKGIEKGKTTEKEKDEWIGAIGRSIVQSSSTFTNDDGRDGDDSSDED